MSSSLSGISSDVFSLVPSPRGPDRGADTDPGESRSADGRALERDLITISRAARKRLAAETDLQASAASAARPDGDVLSWQDTALGPDADAIARRPEGEGLAHARADTGLLGLPNHHHIGDGCGLCRSVMPLA